MPEINEPDECIAKNSSCAGDDDGDDAGDGDDADADADADAKYASVLKIELGPQPLILMKAR